MSSSETNNYILLKRINEVNRKIDNMEKLLNELQNKLSTLPAQLLGNSFIQNNSNNSK